ncbi:MAG TPA: hypothetical protein PLT82_12540 [Candidatus Hydrogenedens sp.]|nr:hypothetical protein [Candidatus Hydrogenedens sp.]HOK09960.1 hypothetical protein [Candidatus Hydrogenedens sp.]HOL19705.1 hypothetical protein [Candidatus Hydrogenedens sp.]HPP59949.1 hypothetical protein [Candidatus Hydrogenedens sp.]
MAKIPHEDELDAFIESVLRDEKLIPAPITLHSKVVKRLKLHELRERERMRFRYLMTGFVITVLTIVFGVIFSVAFYKWSVVFWYGSDASRGYWDYYQTILQTFWTRYQGSYSFLISLAVGISTLVLLLVPWAKSPKA